MIYLDNAATSFPKPDIVKISALRAMSFCANPGRSGHQLALTGGNVMIETRVRLCRLFGCSDPTRFAFTLNCTDALNMAIKGILNEGDHVVTTALEHNSVLRPLHTLSNMSYIQYSIVLPDDRGIISADDIMDSVQPNTRLVVVTHASNVLGTVQPIKEIVHACHQRNIYVLVDGAQVAGKCRVDLADIDCDMYAFPAHKGLLGNMGCGVLYVAPRVYLNCIRQGGTGSMSMNLLQPSDMPDKLESGTPAVDAIASLATGVYLVEKNFEKYKKNISHLTKRLYEAICGLDNVTVYSYYNETGLVSFNIADIPSYVVEEFLSNNDIACRAGYHCAPLCHKYLGTVEQGAVRMSIGPFNTQKDIDYTVYVLKLYLQQVNV